MNTIDLSKLPPPAVIQPLSFEAVLADMRAQLLVLYPDAADVLDLESEPLVKLMQVFAYQQLTLQARINDAAHACMLAYAVGSDLDNLAALLAVQRLDASTAAPESDERLRRRAQMALEGETVAGSRGSYEFHALSASALVRDVAVDSPTPGQVRVTVLATTADGAPPPALLATVLAYLSADDIRPLSDTVAVNAATIVPYTVAATLNTYPGPAPAPLLAAAQAAVVAYVAEHARLGHDITMSGLYAALHQPGVQRVNITSPLADLVIGPREASHCTGIVLALGVTDV